MPNPLQGRAGLRTESPETNALARELHELAVRNGLRGCVLISFAADDRVGVNSCGEPDSFGVYMERLGDRLLVAIADGEFDPEAR